MKKQWFLIAILVISAPLLAIFSRNNDNLDKNYVVGQLSGAKLLTSQIVTIDIDIDFGDVVLQRYTFEIEDDKLIQELEDQIGKTIVVYFREKTLAHNEKREYVVTSWERAQ